MNTDLELQVLYVCLDYSFSCQHSILILGCFFFKTDLSYGVVKFPY